MKTYTVKLITSSRFEIRTPSGLPFYNEQDEVAVFCSHDQALECCETLNNPLIDWNSVKLEGIDSSDYPDFSDAFISYAETMDGIPLSDEQLEILNQDTETVHSLVFDYLH